MWLSILLPAVLAGQTAAESGPTRIELYLTGRKWVKKERFVKAVSAALDEKGLHLKKLSYEYAKWNGGAFWYYNSLYRIEKRPYQLPKAREAEAEKAPNDFAANVIRAHRSRLAIRTSSNEPTHGDLKTLCRIAAELVGEDVLAIHIPHRKAWIDPETKDLKKKLRAKEPLEALGFGLTEKEKRDLQIKQLNEAAQREAREKLPEFREAFRRREKTGAKAFIVRYHDPLKDEETMLFVDEVERDSVKGSLLMEEMRVYNRDILDWSYVLRGKTIGNFRFAAIQKYLDSAEQTGDEKK